MKIKSIKSIGKHEVYDITVKDVHHYVLGNGVVTHNTAVTFSANTIFVITKSQDKAADGELNGWNFTLNIHKSRYVREKAKFPFNVNYESGIQYYSGLLDIAIELGAVIKPNQGWYSRVNLSTGEVEDKKWRAKDTNSAVFWDVLLSSPEFAKKISDRYMLTAGSVDNEVVDIQDDDTEEDLTLD